MRTIDIGLIAVRVVGVWCNILCGLLLLSVNNEIEHLWPHSPPVIVTVLYPVAIAFIVTSVTTAVTAFVKIKLINMKESGAISICLALTNTGMLLMMWMLILRQYAVPLGSGT
jgi:hypothetical protein